MRPFHPGVSLSRSFSSQLREGLPHPRGAFWDGRGANFSLFSAHATGVELCLFDADGERELERIALPEYTDEIWHGYLEGRRPGLGVRLSRARPLRARAGPSLQSEQAADRSLRARARRQLQVGPRLLRLHDRRRRRRSLLRRARQRAVRAEGRRRRFRLRLARHTAPRVPWDRTIFYETHVRGYTQAAPGRAGAASRHVRGARDAASHRLHQVARRHLGRAACRSTRS